MTDDPFWTLSHRGGDRFDRLTWAGEPNGLQHRTKIVETVDHNRQPGRVGTIADVAEPQADAKYLAEEEPVVLQMQPGPHQRREDDRTRHLRKALGPSAVK